MTGGEQDPDAQARLDALIERSSLGKPGARRLRGRISPEEAESVRQLASELEATTGGMHSQPPAEREGGILGIDLGTTHSRIARIDDTGKPVIIRNSLGEDTTPSAVYFESARHAVVGRAAANEALVTPELVAQQVRRDMGTSAEYTFHGERHTPETVSALILRELTRAAEESTGQVAQDAVITVPAYFGIAEREATRRAGQLAGLNVLDLLAEPVAAALHYQTVTGAADHPQHILVWDLGGGTFDTSVIRLDGDTITVICTDGDARLGGTDWDQAIAEYLLDQFTRDHPQASPHDDEQFLQELLISAEQLKKALSTVESRRHIIRFRGAVTRVELTRETMERLTEHLLARTVAVTERTIETARRKGIGHLDDILLVGGMTRMPAVARTLKDRLGLETRQHEPDLAVAEGAALFALMLAARPASLAGQQAARVAGVRVATVMSRAIGIKGLDGQDPLALTDPLRARQMIVHLLTADTPLPADTGPFTFATSIENQRMVSIEIWEQASDVLSEDITHNRKIGEATLRNLPPRLPAHTHIEVTFFMSETGQLTVEATEPGSGANLRFDLQLSGFDSNSLEEARQLIARFQVNG